MDALALICESAVFPNGLNAPGIITAAVDIAQGWPMAGDLDIALGEGRSMVTVYAVPNTSSPMVTPLNYQPGIAVPVLNGLSAQGDASGGVATFTLGGLPSLGEYATALLDGQRAYTYSAQLGDLPETVAAILAQLIAADYPGTSASSGTVTIPGATALTIRVGGVATIGAVIGRQRQQFRLTVWSPNPADRAAIGKAIDIAARRDLRITLPDTSQAFVRYQGTNLSDERENVRIYRRDIIVTVQWDSVDLIPAYEITAVSVGVQPLDAPITFIK